MTDDDAQARIDELEWRIDELEERIRELIEGRRKLPIGKTSWAVLDPGVQEELSKPGAWALLGNAQTQAALHAQARAALQGANQPTFYSTTMSNIQIVEDDFDLEDPLDSKVKERMEQGSNPFWKSLKKKMRR